MPSEVFKGQLYVAGGISDGVVLNSVLRYDAVANTWEEVASMSCPRHSSSAAVLHGKLYVGGGESRIDLHSFIIASTNSVERYDPSTNTWEEVAPIPRLDSEFALLAY